MSKKTYLLYSCALLRSLHNPFRRVHGLRRAPHTSGPLAEAPGSVMVSDSGVTVSQNILLYQYHLYQDDLSKASPSQVRLNRSAPLAWVMWFSCLLFSFSGIRRSSTVPGFVVAALKRSRGKKKKARRHQHKLKIKSKCSGVCGGEVTGTQSPVRLALRR